MEKNSESISVSASSYTGIDALLDAAAAAKPIAASLSAEEKNRALTCMAESLLAHTDEILSANRRDLDSFTGSAVMADRLRLDKDRLRAMADGILDVRALSDPVGKVLEERTLTSGLKLRKVSVPIGVVAVIYESRPNVTSDAAALLIKSGNVCVLRSGSDALKSCLSIVSALRGGLKAAGISPDLISMPEGGTRQEASRLMKARGKVDLLIPRGGKGLINACLNDADVPCIETGTGICHIYVDESADIKMALDIVENAKMSRPSVCNAAEVCLVHEGIAERFLPELKRRLTERTDKKPACELRLDERAAGIISGSKASDADFDTEFLDYILAVKVVSDLNEAISHISLHSTHHSEAIVTESAEAADIFTRSVDSAAVYVNASTRYTDGGEFGLGCEIGISTQKLHARGPMGLSEMNSYKYILQGDGQTR